MHELSVAQHLLDHVTRNVSPEDLPRVLAVRLRLGAMSGIVRDSLDFSFTAVTYGTPLERAVLEFEERPFVIRCRTCGERTSNELGIAVCDLCGSADTQVESGTELDIIHVELQDRLTE